NYPNPFNPSTTIGFDLPRRSYVELVVFNILGQEIRRLREQPLPAGHHQAVWSGDYASGQQAPSGIYFYRLRTGDISRVGKMVLLK
ncbi:MAG: T9SS type A sorting domain-containing protein, partial [candidate division Zixibacteria bacterium]|nr:T9SS type A sorting domain-containing protein [candidate division Zixibacteria bacterium]